MEDKTILPIAYTAATDPDLLEAAVYAAFNAGCIPCFIRRPPNPFLADYFPYPQIALPLRNKNPKTMEDQY